jgi:hypothetical protein
MRVYVSGPMTGLPQNNVPTFNAAARRLRLAGYEVVNPAELDAGEPCNTWVECLRRDLKWLVTCDAIATLPKWKRSKGANLEIHVGKQLSFPVHTVEYYLNKKK